MQPLVTREEAREHDRDAIARLGVPGIVLMENAARGAFDVICSHHASDLERVVIVGGVGQNGGDAWALARHLYNAGNRPRCVLIGDAETVAGDARVNLTALEALGCPVLALGSDLGDLASLLERATLIVDGLFGTGLSRPIGGHFAEAVALINEAPATCVALDLPSGVDANTGAVLGSAVHAGLTVTFAAHKRGLYQYPGRAAAGRVRLASIGVPPPAASRARLIEDADVATALRQRAGDAHKGVAGRVLIVAGSAGKTGAALLSGMGALHAGAGLVTLATSADARRSIDGRVPELMTVAIPDPVADATEHVLRLARGVDAVVLGPGFGTDDRAAALLRALALRLTCPSVLDADALTALGTELETLQGALGPRVLTPHPGEAARLLSSTSTAVQADRHGAAETLAARSGQVVVLKGAGSVVADPGGCWVTAAGTPAMGIAGMGDVLAGVIGALLVPCAPWQAAVVAAHLHARAGEFSAASDRGLLASELAQALPKALEACRAH